MAPNNGKAFVKTLHKDTYPAIYPQQWNMHGIVVAITGASKGIGRAMAISYAQAGVSGIALLARSTSGLAETADAVQKAAQQAGRDVPKVVQVMADVTDETSVASAAKEVESAFEKLDILVNNAGYIETWKVIGESDPEDWWKTFTVNVKGTYLPTKMFLPFLMKSQGGMKTIVNVSSVGANLLSRGASSYQTTKLAILRFTEFLQSEYADEGILTFAMHPGGVPTDISAKLPAFILPMISETAELAGDSTVWLTKERREWLNGRYVDVCWDLTELEAKKQEIVEGDKLKVSLVV